MAAQEEEDNFKARGGRSFPLDKYELCDWDDPLAEGETEGARTGDLNWWKVVLNANSMDRVIECLACARVSEVREALDWKWSSVKSYVSERTKTLLVKPKMPPIDLLNFCMTVQQSKAENDNVFTYMYLKSYGTNLLILSTLPFVESSTSTCVNAHVMAEMCGIEAGKMCQLLTNRTTFDFTGQSIHPACVQMIPDHLHGELSRGGSHRDGKDF